MASANAFSNAPAFPDDLPVADIPKISLAKLAIGDDKTRKAMFDACRKDGFFLLDLSGDSVGESMTNEIDQILEIIPETMSLDLKEKLSYARNPPHDFLGYKHEGDTTTETGQPDRCEFYHLGQDELLGNGAGKKGPHPIESRRALFKSYLLHGRQTLDIVLDALSAQLQLDASVLRNVQHIDRPSNSILRLIRFQPSTEAADMRTGLAGHTDFGTVTLLVNVLGGLQVFRDDAEGAKGGHWLWIRPEPRCLIVNMGDAMVEFTGGVLRSNMHRVSYSPGQQRFLPRLSIALLFRPKRDAVMQRLSGGLIPRVEDDAAQGVDIFGVGARGLRSQEWEMRRINDLRQGTDSVQSRGGRMPREPSVVLQTEMV